MDKPSSITAAQVILWIQAAFGGLALCLVASAGREFRQAGVSEGLIGLILVVVLAIAALNIGCAIGIAQQRNGARVTAIVVHAIALGLTLVNLVLSLAAASGTSGAGGSAAGGYTCGTIVSIGLDLTIVVCLASSDARHWCAQSGEYRY